MRKYKLAVLAFCFLGVLYSLSKYFNNRTNSSVLTTPIKSVLYPVIQKPYSLGSNICWNADLYLIIVVSSKIDNFRARNAIRKTWGSKVVEVMRNNRKDVKLVFLLGQPEEINQKKVLEENAKFHDIILLDFNDTYRNLTLKSMIMLHWVNSHCPQVKYLMKADDDIFINSNNLLRVLELADYLYPSQPLALGKLICFAPPRRNPESKYFTPTTLYPGKYYPNYLSGTGYIISGNVVSRLYNTLLMCNYFHLEDIMLTGIGLLKLDLMPLGHAGFTTRVPNLKKLCEIQSLVSVHEVRQDEMISIDKMMDNITCDAKYKFVTKFHGKCKVNMWWSIMHFFGIYV